MRSVLFIISFLYPTSYLSLIAFATETPIVLRTEAPAWRMKIELL